MPRGARGYVEMRELSGKVAVVTGAASGIGLALAERFAREGMKLVLADVEEAPLAEIAAKLAGPGTELLARRTDVADAEQMDALAAAALERFGAVHVVCNNAGVSGGGPLWELTTRDWQWTLGANLWGVIHGVRVFAKHLVAQNEGHIVNTGSMAGLLSVPGMGPYNVSKHAVVTLSETLYAELKGAGSEVGVSVLCPGFVATRIIESDRNRPEALRNPGQPPVPAQELELRRSGAAQIFASAIQPSEAADQVLDAILERRFYVLTHETAPHVKRRMQAILDGEDPPVFDPSVFARPRKPGP